MDKRVMYKRKKIAHYQGGEHNLDTRIYEVRRRKGDKVFYKLCHTWETQFKSRDEAEKQGEELHTFLAHNVYDSIAERRKYAK